MKKVPPSEVKRQALKMLLEGSGEEFGGGMLSAFMKLATEKLIQECLEEEQEEFLGRKRYDRQGEQEGERMYRNGYEPGRLKTGEGVLEVHKPQVRGSEEPYRSELWQRLEGTSQQLKDLVLEMYTRGMSTRDVESALEKSFGGFVLSRSSVSTITEELLEEFERFRSRRLDSYPVAYLFIDTVYEPLKRYGCRTGVLCCWAYLMNGSKMLIDLTLSNRESEEACLEFLRNLVKRGLPTPLTVTTDGAPGLIAAVEKVWPDSLRIRCWAHRMRNLQSKVPDSLWPEFKPQLLDVRDAPNVDQARQQVAAIVERYQQELPEVCRALLDDGEALLQHLHVPRRHRPYVRTTNLIERAFVEERRRSKVIPHFWDQRDLVKLVFGTLIRVSDRWSQAQFSLFERQQLILLRAQLFDQPPDSDQATVSHRRSAQRVA